MDIRTKAWGSPLPLDTAKLKFHFDADVSWAPHFRWLASFTIIIDLFLFTRFKQHQL